MAGEALEHSTGPATWWAANRGPSTHWSVGAPRAIDTPAQLLSASRSEVPSFTMEEVQEVNWMGGTNTQVSLGLLSVQAGRGESGLGPPVVRGPSAPPVVEPTVKSRTA